MSKTNGSMIAVFTVCLLAGAVYGQGAISDDSLAVLQVEAMKLAAPSVEHDRLAALAGEWTADIKVWMKPGDSPMVFTGTTVNEMVLGGRFLISKAVSGEGAMYTETLTILGFDRRYGHYTAVCYDTWGTYYITADGPYDQAANTITLSGEEVDPVMKITQKYEFDCKLAGPDEYVWSIVFKNPEFTGGAPEFKMVEIVHKRKK